MRNCTWILLLLLPLGCDIFTIHQSYLDKTLNSLVYRTLFYVNMYGSYKLLKTVGFFWPTLYNTAYVALFITPLH